jgi:hypothetical protein
LIYFCIYFFENVHIFGSYSTSMQHYMLRLFFFWWCHLLVFQHLEYLLSSSKHWLKTWINKLATIFSCQFFVVNLATEEIYMDNLCVISSKHKSVMSRYDQSKWTQRCWWLANQTNGL